jgi:sigma-54-interacting transcriptional regulator
MIGSGRGQEMDASQWPICLPSDLRAEKDALIRAHHNLLLVGTSTATNEMLVAMRPYFRKPVQQYRPRIGAPVPQPSEGTLILLEVARLDLKQQTQLLRWLDQFHEGSHVQVVSTTCKPLFSLVETGAFFPALYYRLNVMRIELTASVDGNL